MDEKNNIYQEEMLEEAARYFNFITNYDPGKPSNYPTLEEIRRLNEDKFSRKLGELLKGNVPRIQTFVILTPENPQSKPPGTPEENAARRAAFEKENGNESRVRGFRKLEGVYFGKENPYFIPNVSRSEAIEMGTQYDQTSVIWGEIKVDENGTLVNPVGKKFDNYGREIDTSKLTPEQIERVDVLVERVIRENTSAKYRWQYRSEIDYILCDAVIQ